MADSLFLWHLQIIPSFSYGGREGRRKGGGSVFLALEGVGDPFLFSIAKGETVFPCACLVWC